MAEDLETAVDNALLAGADVQDVAALSQGQTQVTEVQTETVESEGLNLQPSPLGEINSSLAVTPTGASDAYMVDRAVELSMIKVGLNSQIDRGEAFKESMFELQNSPDKKSVFETYQNAFSEKLLGSARAQVQEEIARDPTNNIPLYANTLKDLNGVSAAYQGLAGRQTALVDIYSKESPMSRFKREQEVEALAWDAYKEYAESRGVLDKVWDGVGIVIDPMSFTLDAEDLVTNLDPDARGEGGVEKFVNIVAGYQSLDPEAKKEVLPKLIEQAIESYDNNQFKLAAFIGLLHDANFVSESYAIGAVETAEATGFLAPLLTPSKIAKLIQKGMSFRQKIKSLGNRKEAVTSTEEVQPDIQNAMDADATNWEGTIMGTNQTDGLSAEYQKLADEIKAEIATPIRKLQEEESFIRVEAIGADQKELVKKSVLDKLNKQAEDKDSIAAAEITSEDSTGFTVQYLVEGKEPQAMQYKWTVDDAGSLVGKNESMKETLFGGLKGKLLSPENMIRSIDDEVVKDVTFGGLQAATIRKELNTAWTKSEKGLSRDSKQAIDELLIAGDEFITEAGERGIVFKPGDLLAGNIQTASGKRKYTMDEVSAYFKKRAFFDEVWGLQNHVTRRHLEFLGIKEARWVNPTTGGEDLALAKPFKNFQGFTNEPNELIFAPGLRGSGSTLIRRDSLDIAQANEKGYTAVRFFDPKDIDGTQVKWAVLPKGGKGSKSVVSDLPAQVINKQIGYVPGIRKPGYHYVKDTLNGNRTVKFFKMKKNAQAWAAHQMEAQNKQGIPVEERINLQVLGDRDFSANEALSEAADVYGGLYTGSRSSSGLFPGDDLANEVTRLSTGQSVERMVDSLSNVMPLNEYRLGVIEKWKNGFRTALDNQGVDKSSPIYRQIDDPAAWKDMSISAINNVELRRSLENYRTYMIDSLSIPHNKENAWNRFMMDVADLMPNSKVRDVTVNVAHKDPVQALKGATFDAYLGWFNPRQLWVQTQNAALAISMHPIKGAAAAGEAMIQRAFLYTPTVDRGLLAKASKGMVKREGVEDMAVSLEQFKRSGLRDGIMRTADYGGNIGGFSQGTLEGIRKASAKGRMFFEEGESMARLISWNIARKTWREANPGKKIDDKAIRAITDDTLRMNMNMQRENAAWWQKNPLTAIPTQFLQVQAKLIENIGGSIFGTGAWTKTEAAAAFTGQLVLYGTVGVPVVEQALAHFKETVSDEQLLFNLNNPAWATALDRGLVGTAFNAAGFENNFSSAGSILAGMDDNFVIDVLGGLGKVVTGESRDVPISAPSVGVIARGGDALTSLYTAGMDLVAAPTLETAGDSVLNVLDSFASITSTWSNARKLVYLHKIGGIPDKKGNITLSLENLEDTSFQAQVAMSFGMPLYKSEAYYETKMWRSDRVKDQADTRKALKQNYLVFSRDNNLEKYKGRFTMLMAEWEDQPIVRQDIINSVIKSIGDKRSSFDRELAKFLTDYVRSSGAIGTKGFQDTYIDKEQ